MGDAKLSTSKSTYYPPSMTPRYMGKYLPVKQGYGTLSDSPDVNYFQDHRNETVSMPSKDWGLQRTPLSPRPNLVAADRLIEMEKMMQGPPMIMSQVDKGRWDKVNDFYKLCQLHRDQYKDHAGILHPLNFFKNAELKWQCAPNLTRTYMKFPQYYVKYRDPIVLPRTLDRCGPFPSLPDRSLRGRYYKYSDSNYKR